MKANYRPPDASGFDHEVVLVGYYDDAHCPYRRILGHQEQLGTGDGRSAATITFPTATSKSTTISAPSPGPCITPGRCTTQGLGTHRHGLHRSQSHEHLEGNDQQHVGHDVRHKRKLVQQRNRPAFTWVNQELQAVFDNSGTNRAITISGTVIAHGLTFNFRRDGLFVQRRFADRHRRRHPGQ